MSRLQFKHNVYVVSLGFRGDDITFLLGCDFQNYLFNSIADLMSQNRSTVFCYPNQMIDKRMFAVCRGARNLCHSYILAYFTGQKQPLESAAADDYNSSKPSKKGLVSLRGLDETENKYSANHQQSNRRRLRARSARYPSANHRMPEMCRL